MYLGWLMDSMEKVYRNTCINTDVGGLIGTANSTKAGLMPPTKQLIPQYLSTSFSADVGGIVELGSIRGLYSIYISNSGSNTLFKFDGTTIERIIEDKYNWVAYTKGNAGRICFYVENGIVYYQNNRTAYTTISYSIL